MSKAQPSSPNGDDVLVPARLRRFYEQYPLGRIITHLVRRTDAEVMFRAELYRGYEDREPAATGWALERSDVAGATSVACVERAETSAVARALANLGIDSAPGQPANAEHEAVGGAASE